MKHDHDHHHYHNHHDNHDAKDDAPVVVEESTTGHHRIPDSTSRQPVPDQPPKMITTIIMKMTNTLGE